MTTIRRILQTIIALLIMVLVADFYANNGMGYTDYAVPTEIYLGVAVAALIVPVFWAFMHMCGGVVFGIAAGGFLDGLKLGMTLGIGMALGKCWPHALAVAAGVYIGNGPMAYAVVAAVIAVVLFGVDKAMTYFWKSTNEGHLDKN